MPSGMPSASSARIQSERSISSGLSQAGEAVDRDHGDLQLRRLDIAEHLAEQGPLKVAGLSDSRGCTVTVPCSSESNVGRSKAKALLNSILFSASRLSFLGSSGRVALADGAAHGEQHHVLRRTVLLGGGDGERAERRGESKEDRSHGLEAGRD